MPRAVVTGSSPRNLPGASAGPAPASGGAAARRDRHRRGEDEHAGFTADRDAYTRSQNNMNARGPRRPHGWRPAVTGRIRAAVWAVDRAAAAARSHSTSSRRLAAAIPHDAAHDLRLRPMRCRRLRVRLQRRDPCAKPASGFALAAGAHERMAVARRPARAVAIGAVVDGRRFLPSARSPAGCHHRRRRSAWRFLYFSRRASPPYSCRPGGPRGWIR